MTRTIFRIAAVSATVLLVLAPAAGAGVWTEVKDGAKKTWQDVSEAGKQVPGKVADDAKEAWSDVKKTGSKSGNAVKREVKEAPENVEKGLKESKEKAKD